MVLIRAALCFMAEHLPLAWWKSDESICGVRFDSNGRSSTWPREEVVIVHHLVELFTEMPL